MGRCNLCGKPAGWFRKEHRQCAATRDEGWAAMVGMVRRAASGEDNLDDLKERLSKTAADSYLPEGDIHRALLQGWEKAADHLLEDGNLDHQEESALVAFQKRFSLEQGELDHNGAYSRVTKGAILRDVLEGKIPDRIEVKGDLPFNFMRSEQLIYLFPSVEYLEDKTKTQYVGGYQGVSVRVMKGVYYRVGGFKGNPVQRTERVHVDTGLMGITNKHVYFSGPRTSFRIRYEKIVSFAPFSDGVGIVRDAAHAKPQVFITGDGWFTYNLLTNVSHMTDGKS